MFYSLEQMMWSGLRLLERELPTLLKDRRAWCAFEEISIVTIQAAAIPVNFHNRSGYLVLTHFTDTGSTTFRRYRAPFVVRVLEGAYWEAHEERDGERPPRCLTTRKWLNAGAEYGCFSPCCWQSIEMASDCASNIVLTGPRFERVKGMYGYGVNPKALTDRSKERLLTYFERRLCHH